MVDAERVDRLLSRISDDLRALTSLSETAGPAADPVALAAAKYHFVTAIEGCARVAQHIAVAETWPVAESNADAVRLLGRHGVVTTSTAEAVARAVGFRNVLVHAYVDVDDSQVVANLGRLEDLEAFVREVAGWLGPG